MSSTGTDQDSFVSCFQQDYVYINNRYAKYEPCYEYFPV